MRTEKDEIARLKAEIAKLSRVENSGIKNKLSEIEISKLEEENRILKRRIDRSNFYGINQQ